VAYVPTNASWLNRIEAQFTALRYFTLDGPIMKATTPGHHDRLLHRSAEPQCPRPPVPRNRQQGKRCLTHQ